MKELIYNVKTKGNRDDSKKKLTKNPDDIKVKKGKSSTQV